MDLIAALDHSLRYDAEYGQRLANHLPMLLVALHRLGGDDERLARAVAHHAPQLHPMPPLQPWPAGSAWREPLGQPAAWPAYRDLFTTWLREEGAGDTLRQTLPALMPGCGAAAFHGMIRTAYAVDAAHRAELAHALAYWAARWLDLGVQPGDERAGPQRPGLQRRADPAPLLVAASAVPGVGNSPSTYIAERLFHAGWQPGFAAAVAGLRLDEGTLPRLARHAARLYARSGNLAVLHLVTSAWAVRVLLPFVEDLPAALAAYWRAYAAAAASYAARLKMTPPPQPLPWPQIVQKALACDDEHVVKLVHACQQEQQAYGGADDWQRAATRAVLAA